MVNTRHYSSTEASSFFGDRGFRVAVSTLAKWACVGGGPRFVKLGRRRLYTEQSLQDWLTEKLSREVASTSEAAAA
jgi:hypothetical protein